MYYGNEVDEMYYEKFKENLINKINKNEHEIKQKAFSSLLCLNLMKATEWDKLPVDTLLYYGDTIEAVWANRRKAYFRSFTAGENLAGITVFQAGKTSQTADGMFACCNYAVPVDVLDRAM